LTSIKQDVYERQLVREIDIISAVKSAVNLLLAQTGLCQRAVLYGITKAWFWQAKHICGSVQFGSVRFTLVACAVKITFGSLWFNMASVDIKKFENKYDYPDNYELQQHRRSSVAVEWYKKCITTASSTVLLDTRAYT